jgi:N-acetyl-anhydromuramyl-L-alanine amidase AmpD
VTVGHLVVAGVELPVDVPVVHDLAFEPGSCGARRRTAPCTLGVLHWTGGEGSGEQVHRVLAARGLSIHFCVDPEGTIYQYADPARVACAHAGRGANDLSWGVEVSCYGFTVGGRPPPVVARDREEYETTIHGRRARVADFRPAQYAALDVLCDVLSGTLGIPRAVWPGPAERVPWARLKAFHGIVGHMHISTRKLDPGTRPLERLARRWGGS